jgi:hypothetical protein
MASFGQFLGNLALNYGRTLQYGQDYQRGQQQLELEKQQVAMNQQKMAMLANQQKSAQAIGDFLASESAKDNANVTDPLSSSKMYQQAEVLALQNGDFASANEMGKLAREKSQDAKDAMVTQQKQQQMKKETAANAAQDFVAQPSADTAKNLVRSAVDAGVDPLTIPPPNTPQFAAWANKMQLSALDSGKRAEFLEKVQEHAEAAREKREEFAQREADRREQRAQTAMLRESMLNIQRERLDMEKQKLTQPRQSAQLQQGDRAIIASSREALRGLNVIGAMSSDQTAGPFTGLHDGTILDSLAKTGTNAITPEDAQIYQTATAGLGLEISRAMTLGGGRGANQSTINEMQNIVTAHPGDTKATVVFKYANAVDIIRNRLESMSEPADPEQAALRKQTLQQLDKIPTPQDVLKAVKDPKQRAKLLSQQSSMANVAAQMVAESSPAGAQGLPGAPDSGAGTALPPLPSGGGLPSGWSVKVH